MCEGQPISLLMTLNANKVFYKSFLQSDIFHVIAKSKIHINKFFGEITVNFVIEDQKWSEEKVGGVHQH